MKRHACMQQHRNAAPEGRVNRTLMTLALVRPLRPQHAAMAHPMAPAFTPLQGARGGALVAPPTHALFLGTERSVLADAQLQHEERIEQLNKRWAEVATSFNDWLQDTLLLLSERWPALEGGVRLDVTTVDDVVVSDVGTLDPYRAALRADEELSQLEDALTQERTAVAHLDEEPHSGARGAASSAAFNNRHSCFTPDRVVESVADLEDALQARQAAFEEECDRCLAGHAALMDYTSAAAEFSERVEHTMSSIAAVSGDLLTVLASVRAQWGDGEALAVLWARLHALDDVCNAKGVVGTRLALVRLAWAPRTGYAAVRQAVNTYIEQLEMELALRLQFTQRAAKLQPWVDAVLAQFEQGGDSGLSAVPSTLAACEAALTGICTFLADERPSKARELSALIELRSGIAAALDAHGRPGWEPLGYDRLEADWARLDAAIHARATALTAELHRQRAVGDAVARFTADALDLGDWLRQRQQFIATALADAPRSKNEARAVKALVAGYASEWADRHGDLGSLRQLGCKIVSHRFEAADKVAALFDKLAVGMADASLDPHQERMAPLQALPREQADIAGSLL